MWVIFIHTIIAKPRIQFKEDFSHGIYRLEGFDFEGIQSTPEMLIYPGFRLLAEWSSLVKLICRPKWMPWIPLFWVLAMLVVQSSCFAIRFPPPHFPLQLPAYEPLSLLDQGYRWDQAAEGLLVRLWEYLQVVVHVVQCLWGHHELTACRWPFRCTNCSPTMMAQGEGSLQVLESCWVIGLHSSISSDIVDSELPVGSHCRISFCKYSISHVSGECWPYLRIAHCSDESRWCFRGYGFLLDLSLKGICLKVS